MTACLPPGAEELIGRVYRFAATLQIAGLDTAQVRAAMLISMEEAFLLLDCARGGPWQLVVEAPNRPGAAARDRHFRLAVRPVAGVAWARLFGVTLIVDADVSPENAP